MKKQILGTLLSVSMLSTMLTVPTSVVNAEDATFTVTSTTPTDGAEMVSAIDDVVITFSNNVDKETVADGITVSGDETYQLVTKKNKVMVIFDTELSYLTDYTVTLDEDLLDVDGNALTPYEFSFKTEYNPITTLFYEDFEDGANSLAKFSHAGEPVDGTEGFYEITEDPNDSTNHVLKMTKPSSWNSYYPIIEGSQNWKWYTADYDLSFLTFDSKVTTSRPKVNWIIKAGSNGILDSNTQRDILEQYAVNTSYSQILSKRENSQGGYPYTDINEKEQTLLNQDYFPHLLAAAAGAPKINTLKDVTVEFTGAGSNSKISYTYNGTTNSALGYTIFDEDNSTDTYKVLKQESSTYFTTQQGASGIYVSQGSAYIDNLVVTDTGYCPTFVTSRKNIEDGVIKLNFPVGLNEISTGSAELIKVTANGVEVDRTITHTNTPPRHLTITITDPQPYTEYEITVPQATFKTGSPSTTVYQNLSNDKVFTVKTPYVDTALTVTGTTPAIGETDVAVASDVTINFSDAVNFDSLEGNITVDGAPAFEIEKVNDTTAKLVFAENLNYGKTYTVSISDAVTSAAGNEFAGYTFNFTTLSSTFAVSSTLPADGSRDISVLDDMTIIFNDDVDVDTLAGNITVTPTADFDIVEVDGGIKLAFKNALEYYTDYTVTLSGDISTVDGMPMSEKVITFKTAPDMGKALFYENFDGDEATAQARFTETGTPDTDHDEKFYVENGVLKLKTWHSGATGQDNLTRATIIGSDAWGNYDINYDFKLPVPQNTSLGPTHYLHIRQQDPNVVNRYVNIAVSDSSKAGIVSASIARESSGNGSYGSTESFSYDASKYFNAYLYFTGTKANAVVDYSLTGTDTDGNAVTKEINYDATTNGKAGGYVDAKGFVSFSAKSGTHLIDNILVNDLDFTMSATGIKNNEGTVTLTFSKALDTTTVTDNIKVYDGDTEVAATVVAEGSTTVKVTVKNPVSGKVYTIKALTGLTNADGKALSNERTIEMSVKLDLTISNLAVKSNGSVVSALTGGAEIYGSADVEYLGTATQDVTLIIAVYDADGYLYAVKTNKVTLTEGTVDTLETAKITLPTDITGYTASVFCWDDLVNIKPLSDSIVIPQ